MVQVEGADAHEAEGLKKRHVHILRLVVVNCLVVRILPDHRHLALRHQILHALVHLPDHRIQLANLLHLDSCRLCHFPVFFLVFLQLRFWLLVFKAWMDCKRDLLRVQFIFHIGEYEGVLSLYGRIKPKYAFLMSPTAKYDCVVRVEYEEVN